MMMTLPQANKLIVGTILAIAICALAGCEYFPESTFTLAGDSRLPRWIVLPRDHTRANTVIEMSYYIKPWGATARFTVQDANKRIIQRVYGKAKCREPFQLKFPLANEVLQGVSSRYPFYQAVTVGGVTELIEHKKMEPIFYVTDEAAVWKQYDASGCR